AHVDRNILLSNNWIQKIGRTTYSLYIACSTLNLSPYFSEQLVANISGMVDADGVCQCVVYLPDASFPADRVEHLEMWILSIFTDLQKETNKIQEYSSKIILYEDQLANLTVQVENMENSGISFNELEFELVKNEIKEMVILITQLKDSLNGSNIIIDNLFLEIQNLSAAIGELETLDKNNVLVIRREVSALRKQLKECEEAKNQTSSPVIPGSCNHGALLNMSEPFIVQLNWKGLSYKGGAWGKDPEPATSNRELYWQVPLANDFRYMQQYRYYNSYDDLRLYRNPHDGRTSYYGQGSGMVVYKEKLYYNCQDTNQICRVSLNTGNFEMRKSLPNATFNNMFSYAGTPWQDIDIAVDESGLWAIYATEESTGNIVISKLNETTLDVEDTWVTRMYRRAVSNAFIVCGVLYATRSINYKQEEVFYMYNTRTDQDITISIPFSKINEYLHGVNYNPKDHKLYVYNNGYLLTYDLYFYQQTDNS
uniref:Olfactomedin 4 n=1 Tax=Erpetoichthys calabaricus TaxID=27687 RepID=A0A8C4T9M2_ERPCA